MTQVMLPDPADLHLPVLPPLALYVHIPWCLRKCPYCDFNSHAVRGAADEAGYVAALIADLEQALPKIWGRGIISIFFGGGTPSLFSAQAIDQILVAIRARTRLDAAAEITLEANPGTFESGKFGDFRAAGINRLSIGVQSFNDDALRALGRVHNADEARRAVENALTLFESVNLDLMYALPNQSLEMCESDLDQALALSPGHLSAYHLTLEPNTLFHRYPPALPDEGLAADMQAMLEERLSRAGYAHYETSAWCKPGRESRHNLNYWRFGDYLGIGAGAHSKISYTDCITREARYRQPQAYIEHARRGMCIEEEKTLTRDELPAEFMMNALRLNKGFPVALFGERTGLPVAVMDKALVDAERRGLITRDHLAIRPTALGRRFLNDLLGLFLPN